MGIPAIVGILYLGGWPFAVLVLAISLLAQYEVYGLMDAGGIRPDREVGLLLGALFVLQAVHRPLLYAALAVVLVAVARSPFRRAEAGPASLAATLFGAAYPTALLGMLVEMRLARGPLVGDLEAFYLTLALFVLVWTGDTAAYYVGRAVGRRPLAPAISPKKTWAGAVGGLVGAVAAALLLKAIVLEVLPWGHAVAVGLIAGVVGPLGDLAESKLKRQVGVKDSGSLLPGHGGVLDRFDAMVLVAPSVYLYLRFAAGLFI